MTLAEQLAADHAAHDPYGFKTKGANAAKTGHVNEPYTHQDFPLAVYKANPDTVRTVNNADELAKAEAEGFVQRGEEVHADSAPTTGWKPTLPKAK